MRSNPFAVFMLCVTCVAVTSVYCSRAEEPARTFRPLLEEIQDEVAKLEATPENYYQDEYRWQEPFYWQKIAGWMVEDMIDRRYPEPREISGILDLGCGFGTLLSFATTIYGAEGVCVDVIPFMLEKQNVMDRYNFTFAKGDIEREPLPVTELFDVVMMTEVLEHLNFDPVPTLKKIYAVLADGGSFFLSTPDSDSWGRNHKYYENLRDIPPLDVNAKWIDDHIWHYNREELVNVMEAAGFTIKRIDYTKSGGGVHFQVWATK